jgi:hypothetical protein
MTLPTYEERYRYLRIKGRVGYETFGYDRYLNQVLYTSKEWRSFRRQIILRDKGWDMGFEGYNIQSRATVHHINPITVEDVVNRSPMVFDPENVITVSDITHKAIHYGDEDLLMKDLVERRPNDTCPWRQ